MAGEVIGEGEIVISANTSPVDASLAKTSAAAEAAASNMSNRFVSAAKAIQSSPLIGSLEQVVGKFGQLGGEVGNAAGFITSAIRPVAGLTSSLGAAGSAAAALAVPLAALAAAPLVFLGAAAALNSMASSAASAAERLREVGIEVGPQATAELDQYTAAQESMAIASDRLAVAVGGAFAEDFAFLTSAAAGAVRVWADLAEQWRQGYDAMEGLRRVTMAVATVGLSELAIAGAARLDTLNQERSATEGLVLSQDQLILQRQYDAQAARDEAALALTAIKIRQDEIAEAERLAEAKRKAAESQRLLAEQVRAAISADAEYYSDAKARMAAGTAASVAALDEQAFLERDIIAAVVADAKYYVQAKDDMVAANAKVSTAQAALAEQTQREGLQRAAMEAGLLTQFLGNISSITGSVVASYETRIAAGEVFSRVEQEAYERAVIAQKIAALATAGVQAVIVAISSFASLTASGVLPFIAAPLAVAIGSSAFAAAAVGIATESPVTSFTVPSLGSDGSSRGDGAINIPGLPGDDQGDEGIILPDGSPAGPKGENGQQQTFRRGGGGGGVTIGLDPALKRLTITSDRRLGKTARGSR